MDTRNIMQKNECIGQRRRLTRMQRRNATEGQITKTRWDYKRKKRDLRRLILSSNRKKLTKTVRWARNWYMGKRLPNLIRLAMCARAGRTDRRCKMGNSEKNIPPSDDTLNETTLDCRRSCTIHRGRTIRNSTNKMWKGTRPWWKPPDVIKEVGMILGALIVLFKKYKFCFS